MVVVAAVCDGEPGLYAVRTADAARTPHDTLDLTRRQARLEFDAAPAARVGADADRALNLLWAALAVESIGVARASLEQTVEYLQTRKQFGVPLAHFQALRHRVADLFTDGRGGHLQRLVRGPGRRHTPSSPSPRRWRSWSPPGRRTR